MSGTPGLPLPDWTKWLLETFTPLSEKVGKHDKILTLHETRLAALEAAAGPKEPEDPGEPPVVDELPHVVYFEQLANVTRWNTQPDPMATRSLSSVALVDGDGQLTDMFPLQVDNGDHYIYVRTYAMDDDSDAFYVGVEGREPVRLWAHTPKMYVWEEAGPFLLRAGTVRFGIGPSELGAIIDCIVVSRTQMTSEQLDNLVDAPAPSPDPDPPEEPEEPEEPPSGFGDETHRIAPLLDDSFDPNKPTLRDKRPLTSDQKRLYNAMIHGLLRKDPDRYTSDDMFKGADSYHIGRHGQIQQEMSFSAMSRTGDARILDEFIRRWNFAFADLRVDWDASNIDETYIIEWAGARISSGRWVLSGGKTPWSPHKKWLYGGNAGRAGAGTDLNNLQNIKPWAVLTQFLWALETNRGRHSPAGYDYGAEADKWKDALRGFIDTYTSNTGELWEKNYKGLDGGLLWGSDRKRAKPGQWPFFARGEGHAIYNSALFCYYCGLLGEAGWDIPNWQDAKPGARMLFEFIRGGMVDSKDSKGKPSIIARGGGAWRAMNATYTNYLGFSQNLMRDIGEWRDLFTDEDLRRLSRSYVDMHRPDGTTLKNLASEVDRTGHGLDVSTGSDRSVHQQVINGFCVGMLWEESDYLFNVGTTAQNSRFGNGYADAKSHIIPSIQFVRSVASLVD